MIAKIRRDADGKEAGFEGKRRRKERQRKTSRRLVAATPCCREEQHCKKRPEDRPSERRCRLHGRDILPGCSHWACRRLKSKVVRFGFNRRCSVRQSRRDQPPFRRVPM